MANKWDLDIESAVQEKVIEAINEHAYRSCGTMIIDVEDLYDYFDIKEDMIDDVR